MKNFSNYEITEDGKIYVLRYKKIPPYKNGGRNINKECVWIERRRECKQSKFQNTDYLRVNMIDDSGKHKTKLVHRVVAEEFIPNPDNKPQVNHKDGNKHNNRADNLEWVTPSENIVHAHNNGLMSNRKGNNHPLHKVTESDVINILNYLQEGVSQSELSKKYNLHRNYITLIKHGKRWKHIKRD